MSTEGFANDGTMLKDIAQFDLAQEMTDAERQKPWAAGRYTKSLFKKSDFRIVMISMEKGAIIKEHHADGTLSVQVLKGAVSLAVDGKTYNLRTGGVLTLGASIKHEVEALEDTAFLLTISWPDAAKLQAMEHRGYGT